MTAQSLLKQLRGDYDESTGYTGNPNANALLAQYFANGGTTQDLTSNLTDENGNSIIPQDLFNSILNNYYSTIQPSTLTSPQAFQAATGNPWGTNTAGSIGELPTDEASISVPVPQAPAGYVPYTPGQDLGAHGGIIDPNNVITVNGLTYTPHSNLITGQGGDFLSQFGPALASAAFLSAAGLGALPGGGELASGAVTTPLASVPDVVGTPLTGGLGTSGGLFDALASNPQAADLLSMGSGVSGSDLTGMALFGENPTAAELLSLGSGLSPSQVAQLGSGGLFGDGALSTGSSLLDNILGGAKKVLGLGSSGSGLLGSLFGKDGILGGSDLDKLLGIGGSLAALNYASNIPGADTTNLQNVYNDATNNEIPYVNSLVDQVIGPTSQGYGNLVQSLGKRGVLGSSFGNQQLTNYNTDTARALGDIASSGLQSSLGLRGTLAGLINNVNLTNQKLKTDLIGRALGAPSLGLRS